MSTPLARAERLARALNLSLTRKGATYKYLALTGDEQLIKGTVQAANEAIARQLLAETGLRIISIEPKESALSLESAFPSLFGIKPRDVISFSRQLSTLLDSGITLLAGLQLLQEQTPKPAFKKLLNAMITDLRTGISFSETLAKHPKVFSDVYRKTMAVAEQTGGLDTILMQMADHMEKQGAAVKKVKRAMTYPAVILGLGGCVVVMMITVVLPPMLDIFSRMDADLPLPTRILIGLTDFFNNYKLYLLGFVGLLGVLGVYAIKKPTARLKLDRLLLRTPLIGPALHSAEVARFSRTSTVLLRSGMLLQEITEMIPQTVGNRAMRQSLRQVHEELIRGEGLSEPMAKDDVFPPLLVSMVKVGEESNTLDSTLSVAADFYETDADNRISALVGFIQPAATILIALLVGFIAMAVVLPIYSLSSAF